MYIAAASVLVSFFRERLPAAVKVGRRSGSWAGAGTTTISVTSAPSTPIAAAAASLSSNASASAVRTASGSLVLRAAHSSVEGRLPRQALLFVLLGQGGRLPLGASLSLVQRRLPGRPREHAGRGLGIFHVRRSEGSDVDGGRCRSDGRLSRRELGSMHVQDRLECVVERLRLIGFVGGARRGGELSVGCRGARSRSWRGATLAAAHAGVVGHGADAGREAGATSTDVNSGCPGTEAGAYSAARSTDANSRGDPDREAHRACSLLLNRAGTSAYVRQCHAFGRGASDSAFRRTSEHGATYGDRLGCYGGSC